MGTESDETNDDGKNDDDTGRQDDESKNADDEKDDDDADPKWKALARKHEREAKRTAAELASLKAAGQTDTEKAIEKAKQEAREEALREAQADMVETVLEAEGSSKLADLDYLKLIGDDDRETFIGADGKVDRKAIAKAVEGLVKRHPHLAKPGGNGAPLPGGGKKPGTGGFSMNDEIRRMAGRA